MNDPGTDTGRSLDLMGLRKQFPILSRTVNGKPLIYFDNAASTQKPVSVINALSRFYEHDYSNIHRGVHTLSQEGTEAYEAVREKTRRFINAESTEEVIFTKGATEAINLVAASYGGKHIGPGDEIILTEMEHHSNIVPWQMLCEAKGATLKVIPLLDDGTISLADVEALISPATRLISVVYVSNSLGTVNPVQDIIGMARGRNIRVLIDAAQAVQHLSLDVQELGPDFLVFSGHKMYGPTGTGVLYGRKQLLDDMPPYQGGGDMIKEVRFDGTTYNELPFKFEAGTPNIAGVIGLGAAIDFIDGLGLDNIAAHESVLMDHAVRGLSGIEGIRLFGPAGNRCGAVSFLVNGLHPYDIGVLLDQFGIAIRTGHHCTQPIMDRYGIPGTCRMSFGVYNSTEEIDACLESLNRVLRMLR